MLRRLEKRILVDLPVESARLAMFRHHLPPTVSHQPVEITTNVDYEAVAQVRSGSGLFYRRTLFSFSLSQLTDGYSGSDIYLVCKEAAMSPLRRVFDRLEGLCTGGFAPFHTSPSTPSSQFSSPPLTPQFSSPSLIPPNLAAPFNTLQFSSPPIIPPNLVAPL